MKKILIISVIIVLMISLWGCSTKSLTQTLTITEPQQIVEDFFEGLKSKNEEVLILYTENEDINMLLHSSGDEQDLQLIYDSLLKNFSYKIKSVKKNEDETKAVAKVEIANADFTKVLKAYQKQAYDYMQDNLYSGNVDKKKLNAKCLEIFAKQVEKAAKGDPGKAETVSINLTKNDNYSWDMELTEELMKKILGGLIIPL